MPFTTFHIQGDHRITLGTVLHSTPNCNRLKIVDPKIIKEISGEITELIPKCKYCFEKVNATTPMPSL